MALRFDGRVVVVTGAGAGLGRAYALGFASRGAKVVVNDLGTGAKGTGSSSSVAEAVVDEIRSHGGEAVANFDSVEDGDKIIDAAIEAYGTVDVLVNNAGILRDVSFAKMTDQDWELIDRVHIKGAYKCTKAAWPHMLKRGYGRILNISSTAGLYGNFGQVNYSMAKSGILGFTKSCALEGERKGILSNAIAPLAASRMLETILPKDALAALRPEAVVPVVLFLCHEASNVNGTVVEAGGGWVAKVRIQRSMGAFMPGEFTAEDVKAKWNTITDFSESEYPQVTADSFSAVMRASKTSKL